MLKIFFSFVGLVIAIALNAQIYLADNGLTASGNNQNKKVSLGGPLLNAQTAIDFGSSNTSSNFLFKKGTSNYFFIANDGSISINSASPTYRLDVNGTARFGSNTLANSMVVTSTGDIGIGTTPITNMAMQVYKNADATVGIRFENINTGSSAFTAVQLGQDITATGTKFLNFGYANPNITPLGVYQPAGSFIVNNGAGGLNMAANNATGTPKMRFFTGNGITDSYLRMIIDQNGNVGIGTSSPTNKFHVNGSVKLEGLTTNNSLTNILASDANGNLSWRDVSTIGGGGGGSYINNQITAAQTANMWINGVGVFEGGLESWKGNNSNVRLGGYALNAVTSGTLNVAVGFQSLQNTTTGYSNIALGYQSLTNTTTGNTNIALGTYASSGVTTGVQNINIGGGGLSAGANFNVAVGSVALGSASGQLNVGLGQQALTNLTTGSNNIGIGYFAGGTISTGNNNVSIGSHAGNSSNGSYNTFLGYQAGYYNTGSGNVFLGYTAGHAETGDNKLYIDNTTTNSPLVYGDFATNLFRVNGQLNVNGSAKFEGLTTNNSLTNILAADATGNLSWRDASTLGGGGSSQWTPSGSNIYNNNSGLVAIGTSVSPDPTNTNLKLAVSGDIYAKKIKVTQTGWADYVFHSNYKLPSLVELERYIQQHKHLPDVPSATDVEANGLDLGDNQSILLKKIEELTLYIIEINKKVDKLSEENVILKRKLERNKKQ